MNEKSPNPFCCCVVVLVVIVWRLGGKKEEGLLFFVEKEKPKIKKKIKNLSFFGLHFLVTRGATREEKKAISSCSQTAFLSPGPSVVEEDLRI